MSSLCIAGSVGIPRRSKERCIYQAQPCSLLPLWPNWICEPPTDADGIQCRQSRSSGHHGGGLLLSEVAQHVLLKCCGASSYFMAYPVRHGALTPHVVYCIVRLMLHSLKYHLQYHRTARQTRYLPKLGGRQKLLLVKRARQGPLRLLLCSR